MAEIIAGTYKVTGKIGSGGGGIVYLADHMRLNKKVVLKEDKRKITTNPEILRREVDALKDLSHTYIPQVYDFFVENDTVYTVMDYIEGESLDKLLTRKEKIPQSTIIKWACQLLEALSYLHKPIHGNPPRGIVHSDIKPANIMLKPDGDICLIDFNIALALGQENFIGLTAGYASPEHYGLDYSTSSGNETETIKTSSRLFKTTKVVKSIKNIRQTADTAPMPKELPPTASDATPSLRKIIIPDARSDIYSLGAALYHLLSGNRPSKDAKEVVPLSKEDFSQPIIKIIEKSMNPNPDLRYQTADEMLYDLTHLRENDPRAKKLRLMSISANLLFTFIFLSGIFISFTGLKRTENLQKALNLAEYSQNALQSGNPDAAVKYALDALPDKKNIFTPPYTAQAQKALADSLGVYDLSDGYKSHKMIELPSEIFNIVLSPDGKTGAAVYSFAVAVFDSETGEITASLPAARSALSEVKYINNDLIVYAGEKGIAVYDIKTNSEIWTGKPATSIAVSEDGSTIAGIYRDEDFAVIYDVDGTQKSIVSFGGKKRKVIADDAFNNSDSAVLALDKTGKYLAVSFENGALEIFNAENAESYIKIYDESDFDVFQGGFKDNYFVFSSFRRDLSEFVVVDIEQMTEPIAFESDGYIGLKINKDNIYIYNKSTIVSIDPLTGEQKEAAYTDADITKFAVYGGNTAAVTEKNECLFYDEYADLITRFDAGQVDCSFIDIAGDYAVTAGKDTPKIKLLKKKSNESSYAYSYDDQYYHDEARVNEDNSRIMLFSYDNFRIYGTDGRIIKEASIPDAENEYDQQYSRKTGNLACMYNDAFRLYSGENGDLIYEETNLKSVSYAPYGVSIFDGSEIKLIDLDSGKIIQSGAGKGNFGAYCGTFIDDEFLEGGKIIGAGKTEKCYYFAAVKDEICSVYDDSGKKIFDVPVSGRNEAFFTEGEMILSPFHGTPCVYDLKTGKKIADLEKDSFLTYITEAGENIISEYVSASGEKYGLLLEKGTYQTLAYMPCLSDIKGDELLFDFQKGKLCRSHIYGVSDLIDIAKGGGVD